MHDHIDHDDDDIFDFMHMEEEIQSLRILEERLDKDSNIDDILGLDLMTDLLEVELQFVPSLEGLMDTDSDAKE